MAGERLAPLVGSGRIFVAVSPFERAIQTLYGLFAGGFPRKQVPRVALQCGVPRMCSRWPSLRVRRGSRVHRGRDSCAQIGAILHDPRIREQEFGNFQSPGLSAAVRAQVRWPHACCLAGRVACAASCSLGALSWQLSRR